MRKHCVALLASSVVILQQQVVAHGDHGHGHDHGAILNEDGVDIRGYAERHMSQEHHIDSFDLASFFKLHDLDHNGILNLEEIEAIYGLNHHEVKKDSTAEDHEIKRKVIVEKVLESLDRNKDGMVDLEEFEAGGMNGLPSFDQYSDLGHHYDEESEYFLHHEEMYHNTPETQTDEAYNHPEDLAHFAHHAAIEAEEDKREKKFEGLKEDEALGTEKIVNDPLDEHEAPTTPEPDLVVGTGSESDLNSTTDSSVLAKAAAAVAAVVGGTGAGAGTGDSASNQNQKPLRVDSAKPARNAKEDPRDVLRQAKHAAEGLPGYGEKDYHRPRTKEERLRKKTPYRITEYKFGTRNEF